MINQLKQWLGACEINGQYFDSFPVDFSDLNGDIHIKLYPKHKTAQKSAGNAKKEVSTTSVDSKKEYKVTVKAYMTRKATPEFDFMARWNNDIPMSLRTMVGYVEKETKGMVYMHLHGQAEEVITCIRCGRELTNPISRLYGIGPECITKIPVFFDVNINDVDSIKEKFVDVTWEGWIIKSAIVSKEEL